MACNRPINAWQKAEGATLVFRKPKGDYFRELKVDCTKCMGCRKRYKQEWTARVLLENALQEHALFTTLTYAPEHVPDDWGLPYRDVQLYHKRIRNRFGVAPRFVNVGEYGGQKGRPHWHEIMWCVNPGDLVELARNDQGDPLYGSAILDELWGNGNVRVGEVNPQTAAYVVGYHTKDLKSKREGAYDYQDPETGEWFAREMPKMRTSRNPGIAANFFDTYTSDIFPKGYTTFKGRRLPAGRYFLNRLEKVNPSQHAEVKAQRAEYIESPAFQADNTPERLAAKESILMAKNLKAQRDKGAKVQPDQRTTGARISIAEAARRIQQRHVDQRTTLLRSLCRK